MSLRSSRSSRRSSESAGGAGGGGRRAVEQRVSAASLLQQLATAVPTGIHAALPDIPVSLRALVGKADPAAAAARRLPGAAGGPDRVLAARFDKLQVDGGGVPVDVLAVVYDDGNGFHVWDVSREDDVRELQSVRNVKVDRLAMLPPPEPAPYMADVGADGAHPFGDEENERDGRQGRSVDVDLGRAEALGEAVAGGEPLVAVVSDAGRTVTAYRFDDVPAAVITLRFEDPVRDVLANGHVVLLVQANEVLVYDRRSMEALGALPCAAASHEHAKTVALGPRWMAYAGRQPLPVVRTRADSNGQPRPQATTAETLMTVAGSVASGVVALGDYGLRTFSDYMSQPPRGAAPPHQKSPVEEAAEAEMAATAGSVIVRDVVYDQTVVAHFRAHAHAIAALAFDATGGLLATASSNGHHVHVFKIKPGGSAAGEADYAPLYKLTRGYTDAFIHELNFSPNGLWLAAGTTRGTTHIFAVNPTGGRATARTHLPEQRASHAVVPAYLYAQAADAPLVQLNASARIKRNEFAADDRRLTFPIAGRFDNKGEHYFIATEEASLIRYALRPYHPADASESDPDSINVDVQPTSSWALCRQPDWKDFRAVLVDVVARHSRYAATLSQPTAGGDDASGDESDEWVRQVETQTFPPLRTPIWGSSRFRFETYAPADRAALERNAPCGMIKREKLASEPVARKASLVPATGGDGNEYVAQSALEQALRMNDAVSVSDQEVRKQVLAAVSTPIDGRAAGKLPTKQVESPERRKPEPIVSAPAAQSLSAAFPMRGSAAARTHGVAVFAPESVADADVGLDELDRSASPVPVQIVEPEPEPEEKPAAGKKAAAEKKKAAKPDAGKLAARNPFADSDSELNASDDDDSGTYHSYRGGHSPVSSMDGSERRSTVESPSLSKLSLAAEDEEPVETAADDVETVATAADADGAWPVVSQGNMPTGSWEDDEDDDDELDGHFAPTPAAKTPSASSSTSSAAKNKKKKKKKKK